MNSARYVLLGLSDPRAEWHLNVGRWCSIGMLAAEWILCVSPEEVEARLQGGRPFSALLVDAAAPRLDRDLVSTAKAAGCAVLVVSAVDAGVGIDARPGRGWVALGAAAVLRADVACTQLAEALSLHARLIRRVDHVPEPARANAAIAPLIAVTGPGGTGASTVAIALAQGSAALYRPVLLADLRLRAELSVLHDSREVVPSIQELVYLFRAGRPTTSQIRALTFGVPERGYDLLLGLPHDNAWSSIRPRAFDAALDGLRGVNRVVVADIEPDLEGEEDGGSIDVEERNLMARTVCARAQAVFVVGIGGVKGLHALARLVGALLNYGVPGSRVVPVINRASDVDGRRAEVISSLGRRWEGSGIAGPVFLSEQPIEEALRDGACLPEEMSVPLVGAYHAILRRGDMDQTRLPRQVAPGTVGAWTPSGG